MDPAKQRRDIKWADGLRGIVATMIVGHHLRMGYSDKLASLPFVLWVAPDRGFFSVAIFFVTSGFVCSIKSLRQARANNKTDARNTAASSIVRRVFRLFIPATAATICTFALSQMNGFYIAVTYGNWWLIRIQPRIPGFFTPFRTLFQTILFLWTADSHVTDNVYDGNQWTMPTELFASLWLYTALIATSGFTIFWRNVTLAFITLISLYLPDNSFARVCFFNGALLAELCLYIEENYPKLLSWEAKIPRNPLKLFMFVWPVSLAIYGWTLGQRWEYLEIFGVWSRPMLRLGTAIATTPDHLDLLRFYGMAGASLFVLAVVMSAPLRQILSLPLLVWLGSLSFSLYLLHGPLLRSVLAWIVYGVSPTLWDQDIAVLLGHGTELVGFLAWFLRFIWGVAKFGLLVSWCVLLVFLAVLWRDHVDKRSVTISKWIEDVLHGRKKMEIPWKRRNEGSRFELESQGNETTVV